MPIDNLSHTKPQLVYRVRLPDIASGKPPVFFLFHGYGSNEEDLFPLASKIPKEFLVISARAPIVLGEGQYAWFPIDWSSGTPKSKVEDAEEACVTMKKFIDACVATFRADSTKIFTLGFSQGAITSTMLALTHPEIIKGVVSLSGRIFPKTKQEVRRSTALSQVHFFMGHGTEDEVIPVRYAQEQKACLEELGVPLQYHEYSIAHTISGEEYHDVLEWLSQVA